MFSEQWRERFTEVYNEMMRAYSTKDHAKVAEHEKTMLELMLKEQGAVRELLRTRGVLTDVDAAVKELSENASRIHSLKIFHERDIHLDPSFYMLGWVLSHEDLFKFRQGLSGTFRGIALQGGALSARVSEFLQWMGDGLRQNNAVHFYDILQNYCYRQPWNLLAVREDDYWILFFYACAHAIFVRA
jgi:hypothetical protein